MSQKINFSRGASPTASDMTLALSELSSISSINYRDTSSIFKGP